MTRREFLKKSVLVLLSLPVIAVWAKLFKPRPAPREAMYYRQLAG